MFVKAINNQVVAYPYSVGDLRRDNPNTSFPKTIPPETMAAFNMYPVETGNYPAYDAETQRIEHSDQPVLANGKWELTKTIVPLTAEQLQEKVDAKAAEARRERDQLLAASDWVVSKAVDQNAQDNLGIQIPLVWLNYRQALRDITAQAGFPNNITWPTKPE